MPAAPLGLGGPPVPHSRARDEPSARHLRGWTPAGRAQLSWGRGWGQPGPTAGKHGVCGRGGWPQPPLHAWGPAAVLTRPQHPLPVPPVKRMTKDLSYAGSKNQNFLLAFSFVASLHPALPAPTLAPGWKPSLHLSYCFKPKFTVSVGGKTLSLHPCPEDPGTLRASGLPSALALPGGRREGRGEWVGSRVPDPSPGCFLGALQIPLEDQVPRHAGSVDSSKRAGKVRLSTDPLWGTPT